jgi:hypothetical protein
MYEMKAININELTKILSNLFGNPNESSWIGDESLPEKSILRYKYEDKIKHIEADFIENESGGINRLEKVDCNSECCWIEKDSKDYDSNKMEKMEKVEIEVWDYIYDNFEQDFKDKVNDETILEYIKLGQVDKEEIEHSINAVMGDLCKLFCEFSVLGGEKLYPELGDNPWEHPETIYLEVSVPVISLTDLNTDWTDDKFLLVKNEISEVINEDFPEEINKVKMVCEEIFTEKISYGEWKNFFNSKGYYVKMTTRSFEIFMKDIIIRIAHKGNKHHYPENINFTGEIFVGWVQKGECFNGESIRCHCSYCKKNPNSLLNK